jgi:hypothetical protein
VCIVLIIETPWPGFGVLDGLQVCCILPLLAVLGILWLYGLHVFILALLHEGGYFKPVRPAKLWVAPVLICITFTSLYFNIPMRLFFAACRDRFQSFVPSAPVSVEGMPFGRRIGVYYVDSYAANDDGGVFFRTELSNGFSLGFAYRPRGRYTPFGDEHYQVHPLDDGWYWFEVSDRY